MRHHCIHQNHIRSHALDQSKRAGTVCCFLDSVAIALHGKPECCPGATIVIDDQYQRALATGLALPPGFAVKFSQQCFVNQYVFGAGSRQKISGRHCHVVLGMILDFLGQGGKRAGAQITGRALDGVGCTPQLI